MMPDSPPMMPDSPPMIPNYPPMIPNSPPLPPFNPPGEDVKPPSIMEDAEVAYIGRLTEYLNRQRVVLLSRFRAGQRRKMRVTAILCGLPQYLFRNFIVILEKNTPETPFIPQPTIDDVMMMRVMYNQMWMKIDDEVMEMMKGEDDENQTVMKTFMTMVKESRLTEWPMPGGVPSTEQQQPPREQQLPREGQLDSREEQSPSREREPEVFRPNRYRPVGNLPLIAQAFIDDLFGSLAPPRNGRPPSPFRNPGRGFLNRGERPTIFLHLRRRPYAQARSRDSE